MNTYENLYYTNLYQAISTDIYQYQLRISNILNIIYVNTLAFHIYITNAYKIYLIYYNIVIFSIFSLYAIYLNNTLLIIVKLLKASYLYTCLCLTNLQ